MGILILPLLLLVGSGIEEAIVTTTTIITSEVLIIFIMLVCKLSTAQSNYPGLVSTGVRAALPLWWPLWYLYRSHDTHRYSYALHVVLDPGK